MTDEGSRSVLDVLLVPDFPGAEALRDQAKEARLEPVVIDGSVILRIEIGDDAPRAFVRSRVPVEATAEDRDGTTIHALLHVVRGRLHEVEIHREDGEPLQISLTGSALTVRVNV